MVQVTVELLVQSHQPLLLCVRLIQLRELRTVEKVVRIL